MLFGVLCIIFLLNVSESFTQYYIEKQLLLRYNNKELSNIIIDKQIGTFYLPLFEGEKEVLEYVENDYLSSILKPRRVPKTIFKYRRFLSKKWQEKYSVVVEEELTRLNKKWDDLSEIVKLEKRYTDEIMIHK
jgi:hypothetical protein